MNYQELKQKKNQIVAEIHGGNYRTKKILSSEDFDMLLYFIDEYEELTRQMLQCIKQKETPMTRGKDWENAVDLDIDEQKDRRWLEHYL